MTRQDISAADTFTAFDCSHCLRLSGREWLAVAAVMLAFIGLMPLVWERVEEFRPGGDYRVPYELSSDYWLYRRHCRQACARGKILVVGDSVIWGHYVSPDQTLGHYLNELAGAERFANLGLDGTHPAALEGLLKYYGSAISGRKVVLHFNPLWLSSNRHDLQTDKEFHFNHPELVAQFSPKIPCYKASFSQRLRLAARRRIPFSNWTAHVRAAHYDNMDLQTWTLEHPYDCPLSPMTRALPEPAGPGEPPGSVSRASRPRSEGGTPSTRERKQDLPWVELDSSLQWQFFRRAVELLRRRGNEVFVLVGPFNEHMLSETNAALYSTIKAQAQAWCRENNVPCFVPPVLPAEHYIDASHPVREGYALLAQELWTQPAFQSFLHPLLSAGFDRRLPGVSETQGIPRDVSSVEW